MSAVDRYTIHAVGLNGSTISGITGYDFDPNIMDSREGHDGQVVPHYGSLAPSLMEVRPSVRIRTRDVLGALTAVGINGLAITNVTFFWQKRQNKGTRAGAGSHIRAVGTSGFAVLQGLSPENNQKTEIEIYVYLLSGDGLTNPLTWSTGQSLAGAVSEYAEWTLGPTSVGGVAIGCMGWSYNPNYNITELTSDGLPYCNYSDIESMEPDFSLDSPDMAKLAAVGITDGSAGAAVFHLRRLASGGTRVANATSQHIRLTVARALIYGGQQTGSHGSPASGSINIRPVHDGSNAIVAFNLAATISV